MFIVSVADRGLSRLTHTSVGETSPRWSPNGREILVARFSGQYNFEFVPVTGASRIVLLTQLDLHPYFSYSRDGKRIAFVASPKGPPYEDKYIYVGTAAAGDPKKLSRTKGDYYDVSWSPDGKRIAFMRDKQIYVMNSDGSNERRLPLK